MAMDATFPEPITRLGIGEEASLQCRIIHRDRIGGLGDAGPVHVAHEGILDEGDLVAHIQCPCRRRRR